MQNKRYKTYIQNFRVKPRRSIYTDRVRKNDLINKKNSYNRAVFESVYALGNGEPMNGRSNIGFNLKLQFLLIS